ncbi:hypothetical protein PEL8287_01531 [Roseovarius litorisediminis]|uniref:Uncharacterized protein n=2 Tax=Roseovarius litorisediminis TaxID=1312363 RepID=A0A1Y5S4B3_9RHOB|nr:hypothetical protein PEL8287_01531 [Roseovarius litorisediminis]
MQETQPAGAIAPRDPNVVMQLSRMGSFHQSRLSFMRILLRRLKRENWRFERHAFQIDANGVGHAVYTAHGPDHSYSLVAFAHDLPPEMRSDRVIATAWDATFTLFDGIPTDDDITRLGANIPKQEAGRVTDRELSVSRANRSVRLFEHVVSRLAAGEQPELATVNQVGYLMRTTAVYGSGKLGAADREYTADRPEFKAPFQIEMLSVYLTRAFVLDLVEYLAQARAPDTAVKIDPDLRRRFGIGNSTGLGMAPYLLNHPALISNWISARENALARVRSLPTASADAVLAFRQIAARAQLHARAWHSEHPLQIKKIAQLQSDMSRLEGHINGADLQTDYPWNRLWLWAEGALSLEGQEQLVSLLMEPYGAMVDDLADTMAADETTVYRIDGSMSVATLKELTEDIYGWALNIDWTSRSAQARVWYVSEEKLEPRLGERFEEPIEPYEQPLCPGRDAARMYADLKGFADGPVAAFLLKHPEHRHVVRRAQIAARYPYAEIRDNTIDATMLPIDLLRAKLAFFGACHFDPRSDRWVRINMFQHAPFPHEIATGNADDWTYPYLESATL